MTGTLRSIVAPAWLALLACGAPSLSSAADLDTAEGSAQALAALLSMRYAGPIPALTGFSAARVVTDTALRGGKEYSAAYQSREGCVAFFNPLGKGEHDLGLRWEGAKCDGRPIHGEGTLSISYQVDVADGTHVLALVYRGHFENGMLTGQGEKANFSFEPDGKLKESVFAFSGTFAAGLLDGLGRKTWTGPAGGQPSAQVQEGQFSEGVPLGEIIFAQLRPYPGVEAETKTVVFDNGGRPLLEQPASKGFIFFTGDALGWSTEVKTLRRDWSVQGALLYRNSREGRSGLAAYCVDWSFRAEGLSCGKGILTLRFPGSGFRPQLFDRPFDIPLPFKTSGSPVRVQAGEKIGLKGRPGEHDELTCDADLSSCRGESSLPLDAYVYFAGQVEYEQGEVRPIAGKFLQSPTAWDQDLAHDKALASCKLFRTPTRCRAGVMWLASGSWTGGFEFTGLEFEPKNGYLPGKSGTHLVLQGSGRVEWTEDHSWADVVAEDDRFVAVKDCDRPNDEGRFTCELDSQGTVTFERVR